MVSKRALVYRLPNVMSSNALWGKEESLQKVSTFSYYTWHPTTSNTMDNSLNVYQQANNAHLLEK